MSELEKAIQRQALDMHVTALVIENLNFCLTLNILVLLIDLKENAFTGCYFFRS